MPSSRRRTIKPPRVPMPPDAFIGALLAVGDEGRGLIVGVSRSHIICAMMARTEVLGYQILRWDTRREPTWQCIASGWYLYRAAAERHLARLAAKGG